MKALITGSKGFIGEHLVRELIKLNYTVVLHDRTISDISEIHTIPEMFKDVDVVFHLASTINNYNILDKPFEDVKTNKTAR